MLLNYTVFCLDLFFVFTRRLAIEIYRIEIRLTMMQLLLLLLLLKLATTFHVIKRFRARSMREIGSRDSRRRRRAQRRHKSFVVVTYFVEELDSRNDKYHGGRVQIKIIKYVTGSINVFPNVI